MFKTLSVEMRLLCILVSTLGFLFLGCSSSSNMTDSSVESISKNSDYSLIYMIHGDANYLYHDNGEDYNADEQALQDALEIARKATSGEVFVFHQKPERKILGLFPKKDRVVYHFVNGYLLNKQKYSPADGGFTTEAELYNFLSTADGDRSFFFYFGHEIPTFSTQSYHSSQSNKAFNTDIFSDHLSLFNTYFDLIALSTCNNGNAKMMAALSDKADFVIASPQNLHLSYLSLSKLELLENDPELETSLLADSLAKDSYDKLTSTLQTMVTVGVYDLSKINDYSSELAENYSDYLEDVSAKPRFTDNIDCAKIPLLSSTINSSGVTLYYKSSAFGRKTNQKTHSGWGCKE
jgi:hypothetical protein